jgi:hypothetical protein
VSGFGCPANSSNAGKLGGLKAIRPESWDVRKILSLPASRLSSLPAKFHEL